MKPISAHEPDQVWPAIEIRNKAPWTMSLNLLVNLLL